LEGIENDSGDPKSLPLDELEGLFEDTFNKLADDAKKLSENKLQNMTKTTPFLGQNSDLNNQSFLDNLESSETRAKTSLRMKYEAEVVAFRKREGSLEDIRRKLGLSKRKIGQLLLVDPSAWTRWTKADGDAPPHIYRALEWYLLLQDKHPEYKSSLWLNAVSRPQISKHEIDAVRKELLDETKGELTKKAIFYLKEEDHKRNRLAREIEVKMSSINTLKAWIYTLVISQLFLAAILMISLA